MVISDWSSDVCSSDLLTYGCCAPLLKDAVRLGRRRFGRGGFVVEPCRIAFNGGGMQEWQHRKFPRRSVGHRHERNAAHGHKTTERHAIAGLLVGRPLSRHAIVHLRTMDGLSCLRRGRCGLRRALHEECKTNTDKNKRSEEHTSELQSLMRI